MTISNATLKSYRLLTDPSDHKRFRSRHGRRSLQCQSLRQMPSTERQGKGQRQSEGRLSRQKQGHDQRAQSGWRAGRAAQNIHIRPCVWRRRAPTRHLQPDRQADCGGRAGGLQWHGVCVRSDGHREDAHHGGCAREARAARRHTQFVCSCLWPHCQEYGWRGQVPGSRVVSGDLSGGHPRSFGQGRQLEQGAEGEAGHRRVCQGSLDDCLPQCGRHGADYDAGQ